MVINILERGVRRRIFPAGAKQKTDPVVNRPDWHPVLTAAHNYGHRDWGPL